MLGKLRTFLCPYYDWRIRLGALEALGSLQTSEAIPLCIEALGDNCAIRESARQILLRRREEAIPYLLDAFLAEQRSHIGEMAQILAMMGSQVLPRLIERIPQCDAERKVRILMVAFWIADPAAIEFLIQTLTDPNADINIERKSFTLLHILQSKYPQNQRIADVLARHRPRFFLLLEARCSGILHEKLPYRVKVIRGFSTVLRQPKLHVQLPKNVKISQEMPYPNFCQQDHNLEWDIPASIPEQGLPFPIELTTIAIGQENCRVQLRDGDRIIDELQYPIEVIGVAGAHCDIYDTADPIPQGGKTTYVVVARNEGNAPLTNVRFVSVVTPELEITEVVLGQKNNDIQDESKVKIQTVGKDKAVVFVATPLQPGQTFSYEVSCKAIKEGSALCTFAFTYEQFAREISQSEGTMVYPR
jgi:uncharacterized repeat protein (TIGR01451 family)